MFFYRIQQREIVETLVAEQSRRKSAKGAYLIEVNTMKCIYEKNADLKLPNASTTKIVTALTALRLEQNIERIITVPAIAQNVEGSSIYLKKDEKLKLIDLLYGLMLQSGNDAAVTIAIGLSGTIEKFANEMNQTAYICGALNSHFMNPHGLHNENHYTTAKDLALLSCKAMQNSIFKKIVSTKAITITNTDGYSRYIINKNKLLSWMDNAVGIKTGYTLKAGRCLVAAAENKEMTFIAVVLNCGPMFEECRDMLNFGMNYYHIINPIKRNMVMGIYHDNNTLNRWFVIAKDDVCLLINNHEKFEPVIEMKFNNMNYIKDKSIIGTYNLIIRDKIVYSGKLYAQKII